MKKSLGGKSLLLLSTVLLASCGTPLEIPAAPVMPSLDNATVINIDEATTLYNSAKEAYFAIDTFGEKNAPQNIKIEYNENSYQGDASDNNYLDAYGMIETNYSSHYLRLDLIYKGGNVSGGKEIFSTSCDQSELLYEKDGEVSFMSYEKLDGGKASTDSATFTYDSTTFASYYYPNFGKLNSFFIQSNGIFADTFTLEDKVTEDYEDSKTYYSRGEGSFIVKQTYTYSEDVVHTYIYEYENNFVKYFSYNKVTSYGYSKANYAYSYNVTPNTEWNR